MAATKLWSYACGQRGVNRVRVYQRSVSPVLYIEWHWRGRRRQRSLKTETGHPVTDRSLAKDIAHEVSRRLKVDHNVAARTRVFGVTGDHTLGELLDRLHRARTWKDQAGPERFRKFWLAELGEATALSDVTPAMVEAVGGDWSPKTLRHYRTYLIAAFTFAERKLKWIEARGNLSAVDLPKGQGSAPAYTLDEIRALLPALEAEDVRAGWIGHVAWQTGRRLTAIRTLEKRNVMLGDEVGVIHFPAETDKAGKASDVAVVGHALTLTRRMMETPGKYVLGERPPSKELCIKGWMARAEECAGIAHKPGRGFHAIKRRYATESRGLVGREHQAGTRREMLDHTYTQDDLGPKIEVARALSVSLTVSKGAKS